MPEPNVGKLYDPFTATEGPTSPEPADPASPPIERDAKTGRFLKAGLSPGLVRQARDAGLSDDDLADMDPAEVRDHVQDSKWNRRLEQVFSLRDAAHRSAEPAKEKPAEPADFDLGLKSLADDPQHGYEAGLLGAFHKLKDHFEAQVKALREEFAPVRGHVEAQAKAANESFSRKIERFYATHPEVYGRGTLAELDKADPAFRESPEFYARMQAFAAWKKSGQSPETFDEDMAKVHAERFGQKPAPPANQDDEVSEWEEGVLGRPTQRGLAETPSGKEKAVEGVRTQLPKLNGRGERPGRGAYLNPRS